MRIRPSASRDVSRDPNFDTSLRSNTQNWVYRVNTNFEIYDVKNLNRVNAKSDRKIVKSRNFILVVEVRLASNNENKSFIK